MSNFLEMLNKLGIDRTDALIANEKGEKGLSNHLSNNIIDDGISDEEYLQMCEENKMLPDYSVDGKKSIDKYLSDIKAEGKEASILHRSRILTFRGSDETVDRHGDIVRVEGWKLDTYKKNPVFLTGHDYSKMPVGRTVKVWKDTADPDAPNGRSLKFRVHFPAKEISKESDAIFNLYKSKLLTSTSVGFLPTKVNNPQNEEERSALGLGKHGVEFTEQDLWELSAVPIPSNHNALIVNSAEQELHCKTLGIPFQKKDENSTESIQTELMNKILEGIQEIKIAQKEILSYINKNVNDETPNDDVPSSDTSNEDTAKSIYNLIFAPENKSNDVESIINKVFTNQTKETK